MELFNEIRFSGYEYYNELTREMDKHLKHHYQRCIDEIGETNICKKGMGIFEDDTYPIRCSGATRGGIKVDENNYITEIHLHDTACNNMMACYEQSVNDIFDKYIGAKIIDYKVENFVVNHEMGEIHFGRSIEIYPPAFIENNIAYGGGTHDFSFGSEGIIKDFEDKEYAQTHLPLPSKTIGRKLATLFGISAMIGGLSGYDSELFDDMPEPIRGKCSRDKDGKCSYFKKPCKGVYGCKKYDRSDVK